MALPTEGRGASGISLAVMISLSWLCNSHWSCLTGGEDSDRQRAMAGVELLVSHSVPVCPSLAATTATTLCYTASLCQGEHNTQRPELPQIQLGPGKLNILEEGEKYFSKYQILRDLAWSCQNLIFREPKTKYRIDH